MKNLVGVATIALSITLLLAACDSQILDVTPSDQISEAALWNDPVLIEAYLNGIYRGLGHGARQGKIASVSDDASSIPDLGSAIVVQSLVTPSNLGFIGMTRGDVAHFEWNNLYSHIRNLNVFFEKIEGTQVRDQALLDRLKGEAHFLRAYFYHQLLRAYGGVPVITHVYQLGDNMTASRNSFKETVDFVLKEAEAAAELLPPSHTTANRGRATRGAALALKARVLLHAASDLYHLNPSGMAETGYTAAEDRQAHWRAAKNAAHDVMALGTYRLFRGNPAPGDSTASNFYQLFHTPDNEEAIFERYFTSTADGGVRYRPNKEHGPNGFHAWGGSTPIQQLVDAFQMRDGSRFDWNNPEHAAAPYKNRDPRFYATILYDGAAWKQRPASGIAMDRDGVIQTFIQLTLPGGGTVPGLDTRFSPIEDWNATRSGYYMRKLLNDQLPANVNWHAGMYIYMRYAEILLNYAEASIELGEEADARMALNQIRRRAGMPEFGPEVAGQVLREQYRNERRIELAFEEHRFFDIRRWMIAPEVMNQDARGVNIYVEGTDRAHRSTYSNYRYEVVSIQPRSWADKMYFYPIAHDEMNRNHELVQNPGF